MNLSTVFKAIYYKGYPKESLVQKLPAIGEVLFGDLPDPVEDSFQVVGEGGFRYRSAVGFKFLSDYPETEAEAVGVWSRFRVRKGKEIAAHFKKGVAPVLFPSGLRLRSAVKVSVKSDSSPKLIWELTEGFYWVLEYELVLNVLRLKQSLASMAASLFLGEYESPFEGEKEGLELNAFL